MTELLPIKIVKQLDTKFPDGTYKWLALCGCGKEFSVRKRRVETGQTKSCGCFRKISARMRCLLLETKDVPNSRKLSEKLYRYQESARIRGLLFNLTPQDFNNLVVHACFYCGEYPAEFSGIDRLYNNGGYTVSNCVSCCSTCNYFKGSLDYPTFVEYITRVYNNVHSYS